MSIIKRRTLELDLVSLFRDLIDISMHQNFLYRDLFKIQPRQFAELCESSVNTGRQTGKTEAIKNLLRSDYRNIIVVCNKSIDKSQYGELGKSKKILSTDDILRHNYRGVRQNNVIYIFDEIPYEKRMEIYDHMQLYLSSNVATLAVGGNH